MIPEIISMLSGFPMSPPASAKQKRSIRSIPTTGSLAGVIGGR
jgi:hypothetical protein